MPLEEVVVYRRRRVRRGAPAAGIGVLPDEALQHVLSFLPAQEAVRTCVLARRWRHLWKSKPALRISSGGRWRRLTEQEFNALNNFVSNLLLVRDRSAPLELCHFDIYEIEDNMHPQIGVWIQQALLCKAWTLKVDYCHDCPVMLQDLFISQHLTTLKLSSVNLTSRFLDFSSCSALKKLLLTVCHLYAEKISSPSLEHLTMIACWFESNIRTRIPCPSLVCLELSDSDGKTPLLESMPSLVKAFVRLHDSNDLCDKEVFGQSCSRNSCDNCADNGNGSRDCLLLRGLSEAECLELVAEPGTHAPVLEKLTLQLRQAPYGWVARKGCCNPSKEPFASKKLKTVELKCQTFDKRVHEIFCILSKQGVSIEQINVQRTGKCSECFSFQTNKDLVGAFYV